MERIVQLPDGRALTLTGSETPEQLTALKDKLRGKYTAPDTPTPTAVNVEQEAPPGFFPRLGDSLSDRGGQVKDILGAQGLSFYGEDQTLPETLFQLGGVGIEGAADVLGNAAISGYRALPEGARDSIEETGGNALGAISNIPIGEGTLGGLVSSAVGDAAGIYDEFEQEHPRGARNTRALGSVLSVLPFGKSSGLAGKALKAEGKRVKSLVNKLIPDANKLSADKIAKESGKYYKIADDLGGNIKGVNVNNFLDDVVKKVSPQTIEGKLVGGKGSVLDDLLERLNLLRDKDISLQGFQEIDELLGDAIDTTVQGTGKLSKEGLKIKKVQNLFRDVLDVDDVADVSEGFAALKKGRGIWHKQAQMRDLEKIIYRAELSQNPNAVKSGLTTFLANPKNTRGMTKSTIKSLEKAQKTNTIDGLTSLMKSMLPSRVAAGIDPVTGLAMQIGAQTARDVIPGGQMKRLEGVIQSIGREALPLPVAPSGSILGTSGLLSVNPALQGYGSTLEGLGNLLEHRAPQLTTLGISRENEKDK